MKTIGFAALALGLATAASSQISFAGDEKCADSTSQEHTSLSQPSQDKKDMGVVRASKLLGINVTSKDGDNLGQVQDFMINPKTGKIQFALVGKGFMAGLGEKLIPIPWQAIQVRSQREFALNVDKQKLQSAPDWTQSESEQPDYVIRIYRFYDLAPDMEVGGPGSLGEQSGTGQGSSSDTEESSSSHSTSVNQPLDRESSQSSDLGEKTEHSSPDR